MAQGDVTVGAIAAAIEADGLSWTAGETELTALSADERRQRLGLVVTPEEMASLTAETARMASLEGVSFGAAVGAPAAVDWRTGGYVTPIKNQGSCGSCVSFCSCSVIESAVRIKLQNPTYAIDLSEAFMQFCGGGSCSGWGLTSGLSFAQSTGVTDEACMPYQAQNMNCAASRCSDWQNRLTKISSFTGHSTTAARKDAIANVGPVLAGMDGGRADGSCLRSDGRAGADQLDHLPDEAVALPRPEVDDHANGADRARRVVPRRPHDEIAPRRLDVGVEAEHGRRRRKAPHP